MNNFFAKKSVGFYLGIVIAVFTLVGIIVYATDRAVGAALAICSIALVVEVALLVISCFVKSNYLELLQVLTSVLLTVGIGIELFYEVEQIGWCFSGLDPFSVLNNFFVAIAFNIVALLVSVVACFFTQNKKGE